jgi:hypothetical protein
MVTFPLSATNNDSTIHNIITRIYIDNVAVGSTMTASAGVTGGANASSITNAITITGQTTGSHLIAGYAAIGGGVAGNVSTAMLSIIGLG